MRTWIQFPGFMNKSHIHGCLFVIPALGECGHVDPLGLLISHGKLAYMVNYRPMSPFLRKVNGEGRGWGTQLKLTTSSMYVVYTGAGTQLCKTVYFSFCTCIYWLAFFNVAISLMIFFLETFRKGKIILYCMWFYWNLIVWKMEM